MERLTATEAARRFSELLDAVEQRRASFVVVRRGRAVATIGPAAGTTGLAVKRLLTEHPVDRGWAGDLASMRAHLVTEDRSWNA